jgi:hypothetical protein
MTYVLAKEIPTFVYPVVLNGLLFILSLCVVWVLSSFIFHYGVTIGVR